MFCYQRVYQLLPPPYRDLWLDWQDKDSQLIQEAKAEENKVSRCEDYWEVWGGGPGVDYFGANCVEK